MPSPHAPAPARLFLADHVRACHVDGQVILLDLRRDRYLAVPASPLLSEHIAGWPRMPDDDDPDANLQAMPEPVHRLTAPLLARGLLTAEPGHCAAPQPALPPPERSLNADAEDLPAGLGLVRLSRFCRCAVLASLRLRCQSMGVIAEALRRGRARLAGQHEEHALRAALPIVAVYQRARLFAFTSHDRCLHDALALVGFLASEGVASNWVVGVRTRPFGAHAWAQIGDAVLNDQHEQVRRYTPILVA